MLVLLGGFLGSGKKELARRLVSAHGFYFYDIDQHRLHEHFFDRKGELKERKIRSQGDTERIRTFARAAKEFPMLSKLHTDVVIEAGLYRKEPREYLIAEVRNYFDPVVFAWVDSEDASVRKRLENLHRKGMLRSTEEGFQERGLQQQKFQPFSQEPVHFLNEGTSAESAERLWNVVQTHLSSPKVPTSA